MSIHYDQIDLQYLPTNMCDGGISKRLVSAATKICCQVYASVCWFYLRIKSSFESEFRSRDTLQFD